MFIYRVLIYSKLYKYVSENFISFSIFFYSSKYIVVIMVKMVIFFGWRYYNVWWYEGFLVIVLLLIDRILMVCKNKIGLFSNIFLYLEESYVSVVRYYMDLDGKWILFCFL